jgi:hypothetical protein
MIKKFKTLSSRFLKCTVNFFIFGNNFNGQQNEKLWHIMKYFAGIPSIFFNLTGDFPLSN